MKKSLWHWLLSLILLLGLSNSLFAQWAQNKNAREDAIYARVLQGTEEITIDGVEDAVWAMADSVVVGYGVTNLLPSSGYSWKEGEHTPGDSANAVCKFLYKSPYLYLLFKIEDKSVGGVDWEQSDGIIMAFKDNTGDHSWVQAWDKRMEHFYMYGWKWAGQGDTVPPIGRQPLFMGNSAVAGGIDTARSEAQIARWTAMSTVVGGTANDSLPDEAWISEHRIDVDSLGFNLDGDVLPFSFVVWDGDGFLDSNTTNNRFNKAWWSTEWNENWYYSAIFIDPNVTTATSGSPVPPADYNLPHLADGASITVDGDITEWNMANVLHAKAAYGDEAAFDSIKGTGAWASGYQQTDWNNYPTVVDGPGVDYYFTYDDENLYVGAVVADQIVTIPGEGSRKDGITFYMVPRNHVAGTGIFPAKALTVNIDSMGQGQVGDDLISMADTAGVTFSLKLAEGTNVNDIAEADAGYSVELKIPFAAFSYPEDLGDSVVFIGGLVNDIDIFDDAASNYYVKTWWFKQETGQKSPAWVALGPANGTVGVNDKPSIPTSVKLYDNYPNPFNPATTISYEVNVNADVTLHVYNTLGQLVSEMKQFNVPAGTSSFKFSANNLASGVYFYQLKIQNLTNAEIKNTQVNKMVLLK
jgi:hypothetical protein